MSHRTYSDEQLRAAVACSRSWRGVLRCVGLSATSAGSRRSVQRQVERLGLDCTHFTGQRRWTDRQLAHAVRDALTWTDVADMLGLSNHGNTLSALRAHATRIGSDTTHLTARRLGTTDLDAFSRSPRQDQLRNAGPNFAAAWFLLCGHAVLWPLEPCRYDFVARTEDSFLRIQVKTTTYSDGVTSIATVSTSAPNGRALYRDDEVDYFFVIDADLDAYLIPVGAVCGRQSITLRAYSAFRVAASGRWLATSTQTA